MRQTRKIEKNTSKEQPTVLLGEEKKPLFV